MAVAPDRRMTASEAGVLAEAVRRAGAPAATVERDEDAWVVVVDTGSGRYMLQDEEDWDWLRDRILNP